MGGEITRRGALGLAAGAAVAGGVQPASAARKPPVKPIGTGGSPTSLGRFAQLARESGDGDPLMFVDLAALDHNLALVQAFATANRWTLRPALKVFQSPRLCAYVLQRLPEPRGLAFHLRHVEAIVRRAPTGTDLLTGYPPTLGELRAHVARRPPRRGHRLRLLMDSVELLRAAAAEARAARRSLEVCLELDSGAGRGGMDSEAELSQAIGVLRGARRELRLTGILCYDAHATVTSNDAARQVIKRDTEQRVWRFLAQLAAEAGDLYDPADFIRNGPASSNYRTWAGSEAIDEISPGSALLYPAWLGGFDDDGLVNALVQCAPVMRVTGDHPSVPLAGTTLPGSREEEVLLKGGDWPDGGGNPPVMIWPGGVRTDDLSGGGWAIVAPKGALRLGEYVLFRPHQAGEGINHFGELVAVREGEIVRRWPTLARWGSPTS